MRAEQVTTRERVGRIPLSFAALALIALYYLGGYDLLGEIFLMTSSACPRIRFSVHCFFLGWNGLAGSMPPHSRVSQSIGRSDGATACA
jgi:hypothetical protein